MNYTDELGLKLPELDEAFDLENHWNYNTQKIDNFAATTNTAVGTLESGLASAQSQIAALQGGVHLKGSVNYYADLPADPDDGDAYTVLYFGTSGQEPAGIEYAWVNSSQSWIPIGVDPEAFAKPADITAAIAALDVAEAGGSGKYISAISETNGKISATVETMDTTPTANSTVPVTSGGVAASQAAQQSEINYAVNTGAKNILTPTLTSKSTKEGITCTPNPDGTFTLNGTFPTTSSETSVYFVVVSNAKIKELSNKYGAINVICSGGSDIERSQGRLRFYKIDTNEGIYDSSATDKERSLTLSDNIMDSSANISIVVYRGQTLNNVVIRPMIRPASITDSTFQPYALSNPVLTPAAIKAVDEGAKNIFKIGVSSYTYASAVTCTVAKDGKITVNGTNPNASAGVLYQDLVTAETTWKNTRYTLPAGKYGCKGSGVTGLQIQVYCHDGTKATELFSSANDGVFEYTAEQKAEKPYIAWRLAISASAAISNATVQPMICTAQDWAISQKFVPYAPTNRELYETKAEKTEIHDLLANIDSSTTITAYADSLVKGHYTSFIANTDRPTDVPVFDNIFIEIYVYSANTVLIRAFPTGTVYMNQFFQKSKVAGVWRDWYKFEGTAVQSGGASTQSVQPTLMSEAKAETQEQREEETDA